MELSVDQVARLACLTLTPAEQREMSAQLERIVAYVQQLREADVANSFDEALRGAPEPEWRADEAVQSEGARLLEHAPHTDGRFFLVPAVFGAAESRGDGDRA
ncbi:MAG: aspartyl/glutamyl-tRNA amidotransferase subunit C [Candidatus Schekmanbacteria bacterium]|nr:aspartyl/glutamyl-tRNA amidotransferase subunit C [Candidatus Schekmanbacteria bacterium]